MSETDDADYEHLDDVEDGCGCAEVWETMSEHRESSGDAGVADD
ncbi:hypothetical protein Huta_1104 [Halorhabdus utahensis DSM 12940]|uniref:Uncharacterized protein n=1 Tax=Halorhabdus utahensis (strain DSM 12940 / JCM 11049 / AX-2) TaxID=519442 RepID=C7NM75_HALUD|nr:hypothetical protein [Halorhabdus utahensis]ACV11283.1 hypothetical protein Huta_1104 [Halorhabdus utahensis DSM 12940]